MAYQPWQPGMILTASRLASISPTWQDWTPSWTTSTGLRLPSLGDATVDCAFAVSALTCYWRFDIIFGSSTSFGAGATAGDNWMFGLPVAAASTVAAVGFLEMNASGSARAIARARLLSTTQFGLELSTGRPDGVAVANNGLCDSLSPWTWASGNSVRGVGHYQIAA
ncbi:hypothetical protein [Streptomyces sp. NPDC048188]|uniref:hypothetical protein n=1 Tax=Streptomyces sp. NPDC048188 TaxID=3155749 RepID=UPI0034257004